MAFKPYRVWYRQEHHYFMKIQGARDFIKNLGKTSGAVLPVPLIIQNINREKFKAGPSKYGLSQIYEDYESWVMTAEGWKARKLQK